MNLLEKQREREAELAKVKAAYRSALVALYVATACAVANAAMVWWSVHGW